MLHQMIDWPIGLAQAAELAHELLQFSDIKCYTTIMPSLVQEVQDLATKFISDTNSHFLRVDENTQEDQAVRYDELPELIQSNSALMESWHRLAHQSKMASRAAANVKGMRRPISANKLSLT